MESAFEQLDMDAMSASRLMEALGLTKIDLDIPERFSRLQQVWQYLKQYPEDTQNFLISKITTGKIVPDKLQKVFEYTQLLQKKQAVSEQYEAVKKEGAVITGEADPMLRISHAQREIEARDGLKGIENEIGLYEK
jgi:hypothetical protein